MLFEPLTIGAASVTAINGAVRCTAWLNNRLHRWQDDKRELVDLRELIIGDHQNVSAAYRNDNVHDLYPTSGGCVF